MIKIALLVGGFIVGYVVRSYKDFFKFGNKPMEGDVIIELPHNGRQNNAEQIDTNVFNLSVLSPLMLKYSIDINNVDALSLLVSKIDTVEYKNLLQMLQSTKSASEMISKLDNYSPVTYDYAHNPKQPDGPYVNVERVSHFLDYFKIKIPNLNSINEKVDALLAYAFTNSFTSLKSQLGDLFDKMISAHDSGADAEPYYKEIMKEINSYIEFLS